MRECWVDGDGLQWYPEILARTSVGETLVGAGGGCSLAEVTRERQYLVLLQEAKDKGFERLGLMTSESWRNDPKHLLFTLARYKFVAQMFEGRKHVLEIGCGDAFGTRIVRQQVNSLAATDFDPLFIDDAMHRQAGPWTFDLLVHDLHEGPVPGRFDALFALDVLEHVPAAEEHWFLETILASLEANGAAIIGMPSAESQQYASVQSRRGHVNCKSSPDLKALMEQFFHNVFMFSMNDEVVHTGFHKMAHYLLALGCGKRSTLPRPTL
jgi:2-polyprenyl-3-methyl-5-hydroxy-6-metoxy-1,4-benzoquinol methylase